MPISRSNGAAPAAAPHSGPDPRLPSHALVWVLVPEVETDDPNLAYYNDYTQSQAEFSKAFAALEINWRWLPVRLHNFAERVTEIIADTGHTPIFFNLCDGDETNGVPGLSVVRQLHALGVCYTGANANFYDITTSKITMKHCFAEAGIPTAPWAIGGDRVDGERIFAECGTPLIVKPAVSAGSMGITTHSVVHTPAALEQQLTALRDGYRGWDLVGGGVIIERFITGREFTVFVIGSGTDVTTRTVYPAVERVFNRTLPPTEQLLSFDRLWEIYEREAPLADSQYLWEYAPAPGELQATLADVSWDAYASVGGVGYGRIDLRMDAITGALFVLEVNAQCGLSEDEDYTSIGAILRYANVPFHEAVARILGAAMQAHGERSA